TRIQLTASWTRCVGHCHLHKTHGVSRVPIQVGARGAWVSRHSRDRVRDPQSACLKEFQTVQAVLLIRRQVSRQYRRLKVVEWKQEAYCASCVHEITEVEVVDVSVEGAKQLEEV